MIDNSHNFFRFLQGSGNVLLMRDDIGKAKPGRTGLPGAEFTYGKKTNKDCYGAKELIGSWHEHRRSLVTPTEHNYPRINRFSLTHKKTKSSEQREFRKNTPIMTMKPKIPKMVPNITFGSPVRPSTPLKAVISNFYGSLATNKKHDQYDRELRKLLKRSKLN